uniref:Uncharacterized protein n=1 Tax=Vibrio tasmaniensis TaxID=212663 RepID=A0A0H3ZVK8_9VIBR|nr:hypothetical protein [Vibrio tasmaniensis]
MGESYPRTVSNALIPAGQKNSINLKHWRATLANTGAIQCALCKLCYGLTSNNDFPNGHQKGRTSRPPH